MIKLRNEPCGLILIAGVTGAGKTTTLNSIILNVLKNIVAQRLCLRADGQGRNTCN